MKSRSGLLMAGVSALAIGSGVVIPAIAPDATAQSTQQVPSCVVKMAVVNDPDAPLNVRSTPSATATVVGRVNNGAFLTVVKEQDGWFQVDGSVKGWVAKSRTRSGCNEKVDRVSFEAGNTSAKVSDRFIGSGFHRYLVNAQQGQTLTVIRQNGHLPVISKPNGTVLLGMDNNRDRWSGELSASGDYILQMDSNFRGYPYAFTVEIK